MVTLEKQQKNAHPSWLSSHPGGGERVSDLETLITRSSYNRYAYERVGRHTEIQARVKKLLEEKKARKEKNSVFAESKARIIRHLNYQFPTYLYWRMIYVITTASIDIFGQSWLIFVPGQFRSNGTI